MIVVLAYVEIKDEAVQEFVVSANKCIEATRKEVGNISYTLYASTESKSKFVIVEEWESKETLDAHMQTLHFATFGKEINSLLTTPLEIKIYEANKI